MATYARLLESGSKGATNFFQTGGLLPTIVSLSSSQSSGRCSYYDLKVFEGTRNIGGTSTIKCAIGRDVGVP